MMPYTFMARLYLLFRRLSCHLLLRQQRKQLTDCTSVQVSFLPRLPKTPTKPGARGDDDEDSARSRMQDPVATGDALEFDFICVGGTEDMRRGESIRSWPQYLTTTALKLLAIRCCCCCPAALLPLLFILFP